MLDAFVDVPITVNVEAVPEQPDPVRDTVSVGSGIVQENELVAGDELKEFVKNK